MTRQLSPADSFRALYQTMRWIDDRHDRRSVPSAPRNDNDPKVAG